MDDNDFWSSVRFGAEKLGIKEGVVRNWKHRGRVSRERTIDLYQALLGTEHEVTLDQLKSEGTC